MATQTLITVDEFLGLLEQDEIGRELDDGRVIEMPAVSLVDGCVAGGFFASLDSWIGRAGADFYPSLNVAFLLETATVRIPDACLVRKSSYASIERVRGALRGAPELAIEVVSENESAAGLDRKVHQYLRAGATAVWAAYPVTRHVLSYRRSGELRSIGPGQTLEEPDLLPGFSLAIDTLFADVDPLVR